MLLPVKTSFLSLMLVVLWTVSAGAGYYPTGDVDKDRDVDFDDLRLLALQWLDPDCVVPGCDADLDDRGGVNNVDFALLGQEWGKEISGLVISEFMAVNDETLADEEGKFRDWIEIYNPMDTAVDLEGWYLTDDADEDPNLTKWQFPAGVELEPGEFLVLFASGNDRRDPGNPLHTNFKLSDDNGEDLLLVAPDGVTIVDKYSPYPKQLSDISYGTAQHAQTLVAEGASVSYHVPSSGDAGANWTAVDFDDSQWHTGRTALGFAAQPDVTASDIGGATPAGTCSAGADVFTVSGSGRDIWDNGDSFYYVYLPLAGDGEIAARVVSMTNTNAWAKCGVMIRETLDAESKNAFCYMASEHGKSIQNRRQTNDRSWHSNTEGYSVPYWVRLVRQGDTFSYYHSDDGVDWMLQPASGETSNPVTIPMNESVYIGLAVTSHANGQLCTAVFDNVMFGNEVASDLAEAMLGNNCSLWTRIRFGLDEDEPETFDSLMLRIKYEDGFAAYLNGQRVAGDNAPDFPQWDSAALTNRPTEASSVFESIDLRKYRHLLQSGTNVLAIHALNDDKDNEDYLILPKLTAASDLGVQQYFTAPTPYAHNVSGAKGLVGEVWFSHERGFYDSAFDLTLSTESGDAEIRYTPDGSTPTITHGNLYDPLSRPRISATATIRAAAFIPGYLTPKVETHTYVFPADVAAQSTMSTTITGDRIWGPQIHDALLEVPTISLVTPHSISEAEKETSVELIFPDGAEGFQVDAGIEHFGGHSLGYPKNNMRISFKSIYGPTRLKFDLFDRVPFGEGATDEFDQFLLRTGSHDTMFWTQPGTNARGTYIRNRWIMDRQLEAGQPAPRGRFVHVYINGVYWGLHHLMERPNAAFMASYFGGDKTDYDSVKGDWGILKAIAGDLNAWNSMEGSTGDYDAVQQYMDVVNYADYMVVNFYAGNDWDWNHYQNWMAARKRLPGAGFKFFCWDNDVILRTQPNANVVNRGGPGNMWGEMKQHEEFKMLVADRAHKYFFNDGMLTRQSVLDQIDELAAQIAKLMIPECARWGIPQNYTPTTWQQHVDWIKTEIVRQRTQTVIQQMRDAGVFPSIDAPTFSRSSGYILPDETISMIAPTGGTIYYSIDGNDVRVPTDIEVSGTELVSDDADKRALVPTSDIGTDWRTSLAFDDSGWTRVTGGPGGIGYDENPDYTPYISYDIESLMNADINAAANTSVFVRIRFTIDSSELAGFNSMTLNVRYDDGFVAFINGTKVEAQNFDGLPVWNSNANGGNEAVGLASFDISDHLGLLASGENLLAVQGLNTSTGSSDMLISVELLAAENIPSNTTASAIEYTVPVALSSTALVKARALSGSTWSAVNEAVYSLGPVAESLRITEIMYHPEDTGDPNDPNEEFIELKNISDKPLNLNLVRFTNGIDFTFPSWELGKKNCVLVVKDRVAFDAQYPGLSDLVAGEYTGSLDNVGERIELADAIGRTIQDFKYGDDWRPITDGEGFSLTIIDPFNPDPNSWDEKDSWRASAYVGGSPGSDDSGILPNPGAIAINEVMAHSHDTAPDWIELYNTTDAEIEIGGWYLSDSDSDLKKYRIADGEKIGAYDYLVLREDVNFGEFSPPTADPGRITGFALSENGDEVYLSSAEGGILMGYREAEDFGASPTGVSFGRYFKTSTGNYNFVLMDHETPGWANAYPKVGPIVISEIMYNPISGDQRQEYIELHNFGSTAVTLYDSNEGEPWKFTDGVDYTFPDYPGLTISAGGYVLIVKDIPAYINEYGVPPSGVMLLGSYGGRLSNAGEKLELSMPGDTDEYGTRRYYIRVDRVNYNDGSHHEDAPGGVDLWPTQADGGGMSLTRSAMSLYGNDPNNWTASAPSPGK